MFFNFPYSGPLIRCSCAELIKRKRHGYVSRWGVVWGRSQSVRRASSCGRQRGSWSGSDVAFLMSTRLELTQNDIPMGSGWSSHQSSQMRYDDERRRSPREGEQHHPVKKGSCRSRRTLLHAYSICIYTSIQAGCNIHDAETSAVRSGPDITSTGWSLKDSLRMYPPPLLYPIFCKGKYTINIDLRMHEIHRLCYKI